MFTLSLEKDNWRITKGRGRPFTAVYVITKASGEVLRQPVDLVEVKNAHLVRVVGDSTSACDSNITATTDLRLLGASVGVLAEVLQ